MVLNELGSSLTKALANIGKESVIDGQVLDAFLKEICTALLQADVNVKQVMGLRNGVKNRVNLEQLAAGLNKQRIIEKAVFDELCAILDSSPAEPGKLEIKKGKPNVVMFVGLQVGGAKQSAQHEGFAHVLMCTCMRACSYKRITFHG
eukprot:1136410-Pelagomonas_calceolata.AAC.6